MDIIASTRAIAIHRYYLRCYNCSTTSTTTNPVAYQQSNGGPDSCWRLHHGELVVIFWSSIHPHNYKYL